jgi:hypothetical protein
MEWNIQTRAHVCRECGHGFRSRETLHTLLFDERQGFERVDVCEGCWSAQFSQAANHRKGFVSHWVGVYEPPSPPSAEPIQRETAETLLRKLIELNDPQHAGAVFILAVMLERKRILKVKAQTVQDGRRVLVYEQAKLGDVFTIPDPGLQLDQLGAVQRDVAQLLEHGLNAPANAPADSLAPGVPPPPGEPAASELVSPTATADTMASPTPS